MAKTKGALFSLEASGNLANSIVYDKRGRVRVHKVPANPQSVAQTAVRDRFGDIQRELKELGLIVRAQVKIDLGSTWNSIIIGDLMANDNAQYDVYAAEWAAFIAGDQTDWETNDPGVGIKGTAGELFYAVASSLFDVDLRAGGDGIITLPVTDNSAAVLAEWIADA